MKFLISLSVLLVLFVPHNEMVSASPMMSPPSAQISQMATSGDYVYVTWVGHVSDNPNSWMLRSSQDAGGTFDKPTDLKSLLSYDPNKEYYLGPLAAEGQTVYVTWIEVDKDGIQNSFLKKSTDSGRTFDPKTILFANAAVADIKVQGNDVFVTATSEMDGHKVLFFTSTDGGDSFNTQDLTLSTKLVEGNMEMTVSDNDIYVVSQGTYWGKNHGGAILRHSDNLGKNFSKPINLSENTTVSIVKLSHDKKNLYVLWAQQRHDGDGIFLSKSTDNGKSFDQPIKFHTSESGYFPKIATNGKGGVFAMWAQPYNATHQELVFAKSLDWGNTFDTPTALAMPNFDLFGTYVGTDYDNSVFVIYLDMIYEPSYKTAVYVMRSTDEGNSFEKTDISHDGLLAIANPRFAQLQNHVFIAGDTGSPGIPGVFFTSSNDYGLTFNSPMSLDDYQNIDSVSVDFQALEASKAKCTVLGFSGIEKCSLQSSLILGITTTAIIGTVITASMFTLRKRK